MLYHGEKNGRSDNGDKENKVMKFKQDYQISIIETTTKSESKEGDDHSHTEETNGDGEEQVHKSVVDINSKTLSPSESQHSDVKKRSKLELDINQSSSGARS